MSVPQMFLSTICDFAPQGINQFEPVSIVSMHQTTEKEDEEEETSFINGKMDSSPLFTHRPAHANIEGESEKSCE